MKSCKANFIMLIIPLFLLVFASPAICGSAPAKDPGAVQKKTAGKLPACPAEIDFTGKGNSNRFLVSGFSIQEEWGRWTEGKVAEVACYLPKEAAKRPRKIKLLTSAYVADPAKLHVDIRINGKNAGAYRFSGGQPSEYEIKIPKGKDPDLRITFNIKNPSSPLSHGVSDDPRILGLAVVRMKFLK